MALIPFTKVVEQYWDIVKAQYPGIDYDHFFIICRHPFRFIRRQMARIDTPTILIKYWGKIQVFPSTLRNRREQAKILHETGQMTLEVYEKIKAYITAKLHNLDKPKRKRR